MELDRDLQRTATMNPCQPHLVLAVHLRNSLAGVWFGSALRRYLSTVSVSQ
jgi:hypothetical protein